MGRTISILGFILAACVFVAFNFNGKSLQTNGQLTPSQTLQAYLVACTSADTARTYELASASHRALIKPMAKSYFAREYATPDSVQILSTRSMMDTAIVHFHMVSYDRATGHKKGEHDLLARMIKEEGTWRLDEIGESELNLGFEQGDEDDQPVGWYTNGGRTKSYISKLDSNIRHTGKFSLSLEYNTGEGFGATSTTIGGPLLDEIRGKNIRLSGWIRTKDVGIYAGLWWRVDGAANRVLGFKNMQHGDSILNGTHAWKRYSIELPVDHNAEDIVFGVQADGGGIAWFDDLSIDTNGVLWMK